MNTIQCGNKELIHLPLKFQLLRCDDWIRRSFWITQSIIQQGRRWIGHIYPHHYARAQGPLISPLYHLSIQEFAGYRFPSYSLFVTDHGFGVTCYWLLLCIRNFLLHEKLLTYRLWHPSGTYKEAQLDRRLICRKKAHWWRWSTSSLWWCWVQSPGCRVKFSGWLFRNSLSKPEWRNPDLLGDL